ncbi:SDR family oxidoreductase [Geodermatophilus marinus]|nr:SDR family oxidoreductase [Geodermatophilus sp. LHW52908]
MAGRVALVTGGGRGIGAAISTELALAGAAVVLTYRRDADAAAALVDELTGEGARAHAVEAHVEDPASSERAVQAAVERFGALDVLVSNAGVASRGNPVAATTHEELSWVLAVHALGPHQLVRAALPHLRRQPRSDVVFISSIAASTWTPGGAPYAMGKAAVEALAHTLAREERRAGVRVNVVAPGLTDTEMGRRLARATRSVEDIHELDTSSPFGRVCAPEDVARVVRFLVGPEGGYVNDQRIVVDGGTF